MRMAMRMHVGFPSPPLPPMRMSGNHPCVVVNGEGALPVSLAVLCVICLGGC